MKNTLLTVILLVVTLKLGAQTSSHPTINTVRVIYQAAPQNTTSTSALTNILVIPQGTVNLKSGINASKVYFKIQSVSTSTVYYSVNYDLNSAPVYDSNGKKLFENNNGALYLSSGQNLVLKPYTIKVQTEDSLQNLSPEFSIVQ